MAGLVEAAAFADRLKAAVQLEGSGAVTVAEEAMVDWARWRASLSELGAVATLSASTARVALKYCSATAVSKLRA